MCCPPLLLWSRAQKAYNTENTAGPAPVIDRSDCIALHNPGSTTARVKPPKEPTQYRGNGQPVPKEKYSGLRPPRSPDLGTENRMSKRQRPDCNVRPPPNASKNSSLDTEKVCDMPQNESWEGRGRAVYQWSPMGVCWMRRSRVV